ncbi:MAG: TetR/AcrR family transcriptional regulator [Vicingaceae bacterium]
MEEKGLIEKAGELFVKFGIKSMTMDDISRHLGISKKTLYQFVDNKKDLVRKVVQAQVAQEQDCICEMFEGNGNAIDKLMQITEFVGSHMKELHPSVMFDLKKYHIEAWKCLNNHKEQFIYKNIKDNLDWGIKEGWYRENMNPEIVAHFYLSMVSMIIDPDNAPNVDLPREKIYEEMMRYHIRGIANSKGREYLKQKFNQDHV